MKVLWELCITERKTDSHFFIVLIMMFVMIERERERERVSKTYRNSER